MKEKFHYLINIIWSEEDGCYIAEVPELEGCITHGKTAEEAFKNAQNAVASWIRTAKRLKHPIPQPVTERKVSGKFNVRIPKQIHKSLILKAAQEGVSLNHLVTTLLSHGV
jgi:antitoxin HicB